MVTIFLPAAVVAAARQERFGTPSISTVQAPQAPTPQPYLVPVNARRSRSTSSNVSEAETSRRWSAPLMLRVSAGMLLLLSRHGGISTELYAHRMSATQVL